MPYQPPARLQPVILPFLLLVMALGGCAGGDAGYPSLARRPVERLADAVPVAAASPGPGAPGATAVAPAPALTARLGELVGQARSAKRDFDGQQSAAERAIAAAGAAPAGSEEWARATQTLSGVEAARSLTAQPLADLDRLDVDDRLHAAQLGPEAKSAPRPDTAAIAQARDTVSALVAAEDLVLAKLDGRLAR